MNEIENEYMAGITKTAIGVMDEIARSVVVKGPRFDDRELVTAIIDAVTNIVGIDGGDFNSIYGHEIAALLGVAAQLQVRCVISMVALESAQSGVAN